jgi:hypothetical protein
MNADAHLTYIGAGGVLGRTTYDVYPRDGGPQLGTVYRAYGVWTAVCPGRQNLSADTRWKAAVTMWGEA